ncbi:MAG TPA: polysaccharide biosynthesis/export family protein [Terriglobia bacterium]|nr:polysaccharide biosynthesis/export family protein [Terriglobia bacterium]
MKITDRNPLRSSLGPGGPAGLLTAALTAAVVWAALAGGPLLAQDQPADTSAQPAETPPSTNPPQDQTQAPDQSVNNRVDNSVDDSAAAPADSSDASASQPASGDATRAPGMPLGPDYVIGPEDLISVNVFDVPDLSHLKARVAGDGTISLPLIGRVKAAGLTADELQKELEDKFGESYLQTPDVSVFVDAFMARGVSILGAVAKPGLYHVTSKRSLLEVLAMAGGLGLKGSNAPGRTVFVERRGGFKDISLTDGMNLTQDDQLAIDLHKLVYNQQTDLNIQIQPTDVVTVSKAGVVYVVGAVSRQGGFVLEDKDRVTVLEAIAMAGGLGADAAPGKARIIRRSDSGALNEVPINLGKIMQSRSPDITLAANDMLFIPNNAAKAVGKSGAATALGVLTGLLIYGKL